MGSNVAVAQAFSSGRIPIYFSGPESSTTPVPQGPVGTALHFREPSVMDN
ncbi:MAG: hypothetical protein JO296_06070 [Pseudonocardiales bacterium]|nr:hypothetical protein [Pseudonocardiales bacterium]MBV9649690.1 hypothetical protein [Pseudonocardiales bacterium]